MVVSVPFAPLYSSPDALSEQVDEILFGEKAEILEENNGFLRIKTEYGYFGWINKNNILKTDYGTDYIINSSFADLLIEGRNYFSPALTLPRGAKIKIESPISETRYAIAVLPDDTKYFIHKKHIASFGNTAEEPKNLRQRLVNTAREYLGVQYRWGGRTPNGIDCSGLCFNSYRFNGINIWRDADITKSPNLRPIGLCEAEEGDLLFFKGHVAMYLGNGAIIHSSSLNGLVAIEKLDNRKDLKETFISAGTIF